MNETTKRLIAIFTFALLLRVVALDASPFYRDEALYAEVIDEMLGGGGIAPHYWGLVVSWKPPITFWFYSAFIALLSPAGLPTEFLYRLPSAILGAICSVLVYLIVKEAREGDDLALVSSVAYAGSALALFVNRMLLVDSLLLLFTLSSILFYLKANGRAKLLFFGGLLAGLAVFTKTIAGLFAPVVAIVYFAFYERKTLFNSNFLISLIGVPLAFIVLFSLIPGMSTQFLVDSTQRTTGSDIGRTFAINLIVFLSLTLPWSGLAIYGAWRYWGT
ncbi:MAG: glycosyltransferase family 39 protein, partial [Candidatus Micrarchaeota archaeon]